MLTDRDIMPTLLVACPSFAPAWCEHLKYWGDDERGIFNDTNAFAHHVVNLFASSKPDELTATFAAIERLILDGDEDCRGATIIGILESVQTVASNRSFGPSVFVPWLGTESKRAWFDLEALWADKQSLAEVVRTERARKA